MAYKLKLDKSRYFQGQLTLVRGDKWDLKASIVEKIGSVESPVDISTWGITGFFPGVQAAVSINDGPGGQITLSAPSSSTPGAQLVQNVTMYVQAQNPTIFATIETDDAALSITDPGFNQAP